MSVAKDVLTRFLFEGHGVRGAVVRIDSGLAEMLDQRGYAEDVRRLLGESLAAAPLLASNLKFEGRINLQFQGDGPIQLLVTQVDHELRLRGMARADADVHGHFRQLLGEGTLALLLEPKQGENRYQARVPIEGDCLAQALQGYYAQSEQLPTVLSLATGADRLSGIMLQRMPDKDADSETEDRYWEHLCALFSTLEPAELLSRTPQALLRRLFHAETLRVFEPEPVTLACSCSHASISNMLLALGEDELNPLLEETGKVEVTCEFCGKQYAYDKIEVRELLNADSAGAKGRVRH